MRLLRCPASFLCLAAFLLCGCGSGDIGRGAIHGHVTLDGQPLQQGRINFEPTAGTKGPTAGASIIDGRYSIDADKGPPLGKNLVRINANKLSGKKVPSSFGGDKIDEIIEAIPKIYNTHSTLEREVRAGKNEFDFELKSQ